jgi:urease accessory protein
MGWSIFRLMFAHVTHEIGGWWAGVLHPFEGADHLVTMLIVGVLAGIAVHEGREAWLAPVTFIIGMFAGITAAAVGLAVPGIEGAIGGALVVAVALLFVSPPRMSAVLPIAAVVGGALHGVSYRTGGVAEGSATAYIAGFVFTTCVLQSFGALVGTAVGRSSVARRAFAVVGCVAAVAAVA